MPVQPVLILMNLGNNITTQVPVPAKIVNYFNITPPTAATNVAILRERRAHTRRVFDPNNLAAASTQSTAVQLARWYDTTVNKGRRGAGKLIKIPTEILLNPQQPATGVRIVSLRVPHNATNYVIAQWINGKFQSHKPTFFWTPGGVKYPVVVPTQTDPNPGPPAPPAPPAP